MRGSDCLGAALLTIVTGLERLTPEVLQLPVVNKHTPVA
jgi:hypothetical protein